MSNRLESLSRAAVAFTVATTALTSTSWTQSRTWPTRGWPTSTPEAQGISKDRFDALATEIEAGKFGNVDRMVVIRNGHLVIDRRFARDYVAISRGKRSPLGCGTDTCDGWTEGSEFNYFDPSTHPFYKGRGVHTLQSVTKSVAATVIGVAIHRGAIRGVDLPITSFLESYNLTKIDPRLKRATLADVLTMRSGIEWHEQDRPLDSTNTTLQLERSRDWVQFTIDQPMDADPGTKWAYNSGGSHLLSAVIRQTTGAFIDKYAEEHLFRPLGIREYHWKKTPTGLPDTEGGLYLEAPDLAKIGYLYLKDGVWDNQRLLPEGWTRDATKRQAERVNQQGWGYGYQWWRLDRAEVEVWAGLGFGGQFLLVLPAFDMIGVANSWNVFGERVPGVLGPLLDAMIEAGKAAR